MEPRRRGFSSGRESGAEGTARREGSLEARVGLAYGVAGRGGEVGIR